MGEDAVEVVRMRNDFYRHNYRKLMLALLISVLTLVVLLSCVVYLITHPPAPQYFAVTSDGRITPLVPLQNPNLSNAALLQWASTAAVAAFSYNFVNYREALQKLTEFFTRDGWDSFATALRKSNNLEAVIAKKLIVSAVVTGAPVILEQGLSLGGQYTWRVQMPLLVTYQSASQVTQQNVTVSLLIQRISTLTSVRGIGISQFVVSGGGNING